MNTTFRIITATVGAIAAVGAFVVTAPRPDTSVSDIRDAQGFNADMAESAPQQTVVNGWESNDILAYMAEQQDAYLAQHSLLLLIVALLIAATLFATIGRRGTSGDATPAAPPARAAAPTAQPAPQSAPQTAPAPPSAQGHQLNG